MSKVGAIIQARLASTRLPAKVVNRMPNGRSVIEHIVDRIKAVKEIDEVIVAIPEGDKYSLLQQCAARSGAAVFYGDADDVLSRYYHCARQYNLDVILRVTADDPFRDAEVENAAIRLLLSDETIEYVNTVGLPEGVNTEVFRMRALEKAYVEARFWSEREHVTPYIWKNHHIFKCRQLVYGDSPSDCRLTLDVPEDWKVITAVDQALYQAGAIYTIHDIMAFLDQHQEIKRINQNIECGSGYKKSIAEDRYIR